jgi:two-component system NtrC family response regulator
MQAKLMRVLQEGELRPLGSNKARKIDIRIVAASSASLRQMVDSGRFREDLYYRLHVYPIYVPALDERREDIPLLANHFLKKFAREQKKPMESLHERLLDFMRQRRWEGNIRELENFVERLVPLALPAMTILDDSVLPPDYQKDFKKFNAAPSVQTIRRSLNESLAEHEQQLIRQGLIENEWNQSQAARALKISEPNLRYRMNKLGIVKNKT